jgi:hypothetical protein
LRSPAISSTALIRETLGNFVNVCYARNAVMSLRSVSSTSRGASRSTTAFTRTCCPASHPVAMRDLARVGVGRSRARG